MADVIGIITAIVALIQILQSTGLLAELIDIIKSIIIAIGGGATPTMAILGQAPALMKLYAKCPPEIQKQIDAIILKLQL